MCLHLPAFMCIFNLGEKNSWMEMANLEILSKGFAGDEVEKVVQ